ncbi:MAG: hypothetical protein RSC56_05020 [Acidaminococcaceae bacterium]
MYFFGISIAIFMAFYVYTDAKKKKLPTASMWAFATFLVWIIGFPLYWYKHIKK